MTMLTLCNSNNGNNGNNGIFPTKKRRNRHDQHSQRHGDCHLVSTRNAVAAVVPLQGFKRFLSQWREAILKLKLADMSGKGQGDGSDGNDSISSTKKMKTRHDKHPQNNVVCDIVSSRNAVFAVMPSPYFTQSTGSPRQSLSGKHVQIGFLGTMSIIAAIMIFMYATTFQPETVSILLSATLLGVIGLMLAITLVGVQFRGFDFSRLTESVLWSVFCVALIWIVNKQVPFTLGVSVLSLRWFAVLMGVCEELFFRLFLCTFIMKVTGSDLFGIVISSFTWAIYHIARYSAHAGSYWIVFMAGLGLGFALLKSRLGDSVIFAHAVVNYLATP